MIPIIFIVVYSYTYTFLCVHMWSELMPKQEAFFQHFYYLAHLHAYCHQVTTCKVKVTTCGSRILTNVTTCD